MPFKSTEEAVKRHPNLEKYSDKAIRGWVESFNNAMDSKNDESYAFAVAYSVANKIDGKKASLIFASESEALQHLADITGKRIKIALLNKDASEAEQLKSIREDGLNLQYIENPSDKIKLLAVKYDPRAIQFVKNPSEELKLQAVKTDGSAIVYIKNPSERVKEEAVKENPWVIKYIKNPSPKLQLIATKIDSQVIEVIENPTPEAIEESKKGNDPYPGTGDFKLSDY